MNSAPYVFDVDHLTKIISGLSITVLQKKIQKIIRFGLSLLTFPRTGLIFSLLENAVNQAFHLARSASSGKKSAISTPRKALARCVCF